MLDNTHARSRRCLPILSALALAACNVPGPVPSLRYELSGVTDWAERGDARYGGEIHGADVEIALHQADTPITVVIENATGQQLTFRVGPDAGATREAVGQVLLRQLGGGPVGGPDMVSYVAMQDVVLDSGWRATFYVDQPYGRPILYGQGVVVAVEGENAAGERIRRRLPLMALRRSTVPVDG